MNIFDEQTDFSFLNVTDTKSVSSTEQRKDRSVKTDKITIGVTLTNKGRPSYSKGYHTAESKRKIGAANKGRKMSEETKAKLRQARLGSKASEETRAKISAFMKSRIVSEETRAKRSANGKGRKMSEATRTKIAKTLRGRPSKKAMSVMTPNGAFRSLTEAAEFYGTDDGFIRRALHWDIGFYYITKD